MYALQTLGQLSLMSAEHFAFVVRLLLFTRFKSVASSE